MRNNISTSYSKRVNIRNHKLRKNANANNNEGTKSEIICAITFFIGLLLALPMIDIYRITIISWQYSFYYSLSLGILIAIFTKNTKYIKENFHQRNFLYPVLYYTIAAGFSSSYLFFAFNYYLAFPETTYHSYYIKEKASMSGPKGHRSEREPLVRFDYFGQEKELVFSYSQTSQVAAATRVGITTRKGRLGFDVIQSRELL